MYQLLGQKKPKAEVSGVMEMCAASSRNGSGTKPVLSLQPGFLHSSTTAGTVHPTRPCLFLQKQALPCVFPTPPHRSGLGVSKFTCLRKKTEKGALPVALCVPGLHPVCRKPLRTINENMQHLKDLSPAHSP